MKFNDEESRSNLSRSILGSQLTMKKRKKKRSAGTGNSVSDLSDNSEMYAET